MKALYGVALATFLLWLQAAPAVAECSSTKCPDAAAIAQGRATIQETCGCTRAGQTHGKYVKCVKSTLKLANLTALIPDKPCRKLIMQCESASICGKPNAAVCCTLKKNGKLKASIAGKPTKCKGSACGAFLGLFSTFDACATDGTCAGPVTTTTTTTTIPSAGGAVLQGALIPTPGRFNFNLMLGIPGANSACNTSFPGTHACTYAELQSAAAAGDLDGLRDTAGTAVTSFWAIDSSQPGLQQCIDDAAGGSSLNWEYGTAHTPSRGQKVSLDNAAGTLGPLQSGVQCNLGGSSSVGCCR